jgi:hypothetical protein
MVPLIFHNFIIIIIIIIIIPFLFLLSSLCKYKFIL